MIELFGVLIDTPAKGARRGTLGALSTSRDRKATTSTIHRLIANLDRNNIARFMFMSLDFLTTLILLNRHPSHCRSSNQLDHHGSLHAIFTAV